MIVSTYIFPLGNPASKKMITEMRDSCFLGGKIWIRTSRDKECNVKKVLAFTSFLTLRFYWRSRSSRQLQIRNLCFHSDSEPALNNCTESLHLYKFVGCMCTKLWVFVSKSGSLPWKRRSPFLFFTGRVPALVLVNVKNYLYLPNPYSAVNLENLGRLFANFLKL